MEFNSLPFEMQLEIVKYNENFRRINTTFYTKGYLIFKEWYMNNPITMNEFSNYYFNSNDKSPIIIYDYNNLDVTIYVVQQVFTSQYYFNTYTIKYNPECIKPEFYISNICIYTSNYYMYNTKQLKQELLKIKNYQFDAITSLMLLEQRGNIINQKYINQYIDSIYPMIYDNDASLLINKIVTDIYMKNQIELLGNKYPTFDLALQLSFKNLKAVHTNKFNEYIANFTDKENVKEGLNLLFK